VRLETGCWWKRVPDALAFFFRRSIFELVFSLNNEATYSCLYTWMVSRTMTVFLHSLFPRVGRIKGTNRGEFRQILSRVLVTIMVPDRVPTRALLTARICCAYSLRARHARTIRIGRLYAHVHATYYAACERISRILDAQCNALSRCGSRLPRGDAFDKQRHPRLSCLRPRKRVIAKKCRVIYPTAHDLTTGTI